jgi:hypothetical protein
MASLKESGNILSVDLAYKHYPDNGFAFLEKKSKDVQVIKPDDLSLRGVPSARDMAASLASFSDKQGVSVLLLDGPQGWRFPHSQIEHMRLCERVLNTPGKTGNPGNVKPRTYLRYIQFSIDLFHHLRANHGWELLTQDWADRPGKRWVVETFPSTAWRTLGLMKLPTKNKTTPEQLDSWRKDLALITVLNLPPNLTHDELQASVVLPVGQAIVERNPHRVILSGIDPIMTEEDVVLEGWIVNPLTTEI